MATSNSRNASTTTSWNKPYPERGERFMDGPPERGRLNNVFGANSEVADDLAAGAGGQRLQGLELDAGTDGAHAAVGEPDERERVQRAQAGQAAIAAAVDVRP